MRMRSAIAVLIATLAGFTLLPAFQNFAKQWREYPGTEYNDFPVPEDYREKTEWVFARLMYPPMAGVHGRGGFGGYGRWARGNSWTEGYSSWTTDYPRSDRHFS